MPGANSSTILTNLDFQDLKNTLKSYLKTQDRFNDYDFEGSNMSILLDLLTYNTYMNSFYLNMVGNEMFLDTAQIRDSVVSHAKELNYVPRSFSSSVATISLELTTTDTSQRSVTIPKGTTFSTRIGDRSFIFSTDQNIVVTDVTTNANGSLTFTSGNIKIYEGSYYTDTYTVNSQNPVKYLITNRQVDISSVGVTVIEDIGATTHYYNRASSLFNLNENSKVYFIQGASNDQYEVVFGDGVIGRKPLENAIIVIEYRISNGELPNGAFQFTPDNAIDGITNIGITVVEKASSGSVMESIDSIKYNAPRHFATQERAVTTEDYENLLLANFPEINAVVAYGGEEVDPPQYGKVFVSVDIRDVDGLPSSKIDQYYKFLKPRSPVAIDPVFVDPDDIYIFCETIVKYNINLTGLNVDDIKTLVTSSILSFAQTNLNNFNRTLRYSKLVNAIDNAHPAIVSNETIVKAVKLFSPETGVYKNATIDFGLPLTPLARESGENQSEHKHTLESSVFTYGGQQAYLEDDGEGKLFIMSTREHTTIAEVGTIDYSTGTLRITNFKVDSYPGNSIKFYASTQSMDISATKNTVLHIVDSDIAITVQQVRE